jgi:hypothetical protein
LDTVKAFHAQDDTIVTTLFQDFKADAEDTVEYLFWRRKENVLGNPLVIPYPNMTHLKGKRHTRLHVLTRANGRIDGDARFPT